ncbi:MAG: TolC family protein [Desulfobacterales bacterium]|nr:TolC family protein [Desulfobacterales bacterium]
MFPRTGLFGPILLLVFFLWVVFPGGSAVSGRSLRFQEVLTLAENNAYDLKIARSDVKISRHRLDEVRSLYYPSLDFQLYNEYVYVPEENEQGVVSVGSSVSTTLESTYQHSVVASLNYQLYDFGARGLKYENARREMDIARLNLDRSRVDLRIQVLESYARGLRLWRRHESALRILELRKEIYRSALQLKEAGTVGQRQVQEFALELAEAMGRVDDLEREYQNALNDLAYYTGDPYLAVRTAFTDFPEPDQNEPIPEVARLAEIRVIEAEIDGKRAEVEIAQKEMLPRLVAYGAYRMYGSDPDSFGRSLKEISERDATVAVVAEWNLFSGFRDVSKVRRLKAEVERLTYEKQKRAADLARDIKSSYQAYRLLVDRNEQWQKRRSRIRLSREIDSRLSRQQLLDGIAHLEHEVELVRHQLDLDLKKIDRAVAGLKLAFWREGQTN